MHSAWYQQQSRTDAIVREREGACAGGLVELKCCVFDTIGLGKQASGACQKHQTSRCCLTYTVTLMTMIHKALSTRMLPMENYKI